MRSFQGNGVQGNRGGLGKQSLSLAKKGVPACRRGDCHVALLLAMTIKGLRTRTLHTVIPRKGVQRLDAGISLYNDNNEKRR